MDFQFYPTSLALARRAWAKFKNKNYVRVLEPSAGEGDLIVGMPHWDSPYARRAQIDVIELDVSKHPVLREKGLSVVGLDFMQFQNGSAYSHVIMNPPFAEGVHHVLKAWDICWDAEIVAIINATNLRNPFSKERRRLLALIEEFGEVEYIQDAFVGDGVRREAQVEVALVYLRKEADESQIFGDLLAQLSIDSETGEGLAGSYQQPHELALPQSEIESRVAAFNAAVATMKDSVMMEAKASHYANLIGQTMAERMSGQSIGRRETTVDFVRAQIGCRYSQLKDAAWAGVLRSTAVTSRLSSKAQRRVEAEFDQIKQLDFTLTNIYGFLQGLIESQRAIQIEMVCDIFDEIIKYHEENTVFYKGWKSNSKHRTAGMRIKTTRFVLPRNPSWCNHLDWDAMQRLRDFDKVFAMVDGKSAPEISLESVFTNDFSKLIAGERISASYFDVRYYPGAQTIHFYPRDKKLIDRFNRMVGMHRQWLPPATTNVHPDFWIQYESAERFNKEVRSAINQNHRASWGDPVRELFYRSENEQAQAQAIVSSALDVVLEKHGLQIEFAIANSEQPALLLAA